MRIIFIIFLLPFLAKSQDTLRINHRGDIKLNGISTSINNTNQTVVSTSILYDIKDGEVFDGLSTLDYTNIHKNKSLISNDLVVKLQPRLTYGNWALYNYEQFSTLYSRNVIFRFESFVGSGYYFLNNKILRFSISYGLIFSNTKYMNDSISNVVRNSVRIQLFGNLKNISFLIEGYCQPKFDDIGDMNYKWNCRLITPITNKLVISVNSIRTFESKNYSTDIKVYQLNNMLTFGIEYKF